MQINFKIKVPEDLDLTNKEERIKIDLDTIVSTIHNLIPETERKNIIVVDGDEWKHKYESFSQIAEIYKRDGKVGIIYVGKDFYTGSLN